MELVTLGVEVKSTGSQQGSQELGKFSTAAKGAAASADALEDQIRALGAAQAQTANTSRPLAGAMTGIGQAFKNNASSIQNASFQLQDIVVQMSMGVPAARTLGMQLPQLLGGFGPLGAVVGLAVGALLAFAPAAFGAADGAAELKAAVDQLEDAMQRLRSAQEGQSFINLTQQYGVQAGAARELLDIQKQIAQVEADRAFRAASEAVGRAMGEGLQAQTPKSALDNAKALNFALREQAEIAKVVQQIQEGSLTLNEEEAAALGRRRRAYEDILGMIAPYRRGLEEITEQFGLSEQAAADLAVKLAEVNNADTTEERVAAAQALAYAIDEATNGLDASSDEGLKLYDALLKASLAGLELQQIDLASGIDAAASSAAALARQLGISVDLASRLMASGYTGKQQPVIFDPRDPNYDPIAAGAERLRLGAGHVSPFDPSRLPGAGAGGGGGGGGASRADQEAARLYESTRTEAEKYAAEIEKLQALYQSGAIDTDLYSRALEDLNQKFDPLQKVVQGVAGTIESELNNAFASVLKGTATLSEALLDFAANVLAKVAQDLFAQQFAGPIAQGVSGFLGGLFSAKGNVFNSSGVTPFAQGGVVSGPTVFPFANGVGLMGEAGPEAIMPLSRGADGRLGVVANSNNAPTVTINNYSGQPATASTDSAGNITVEIGRAVAQDITSGGPAYRAIRSTFGLANRLQQRG